MLAHIDAGNPVTVLDPACGDGELLAAIAAEGPDSIASLTGIDRDVDAVEQSRHRLEGNGHPTDVHTSDFIDPESFDLAARRFGAVISNPPYVRTQVLGADEAQRLAQKFGLKGRVDLYHAFACRMSEHLEEGGVLGLLCSNRFLTTKGGASLRGILAEQFELLELYDLGDTKLFSAAVLPAMLIARKKGMFAGLSDAPRFARIYETTAGTDDRVADSIFEPLEEGWQGNVRVGGATYEIDCGELNTGDSKSPWSLRNGAQTAFLDSVEKNTARRFADYGKIRVGVKTTADAVFIRDDWDSLPEDIRPEAELLYPLVTHHTVSRWRVGEQSTRILYPYDMSERKRKLLELDKFPRTVAYLESHRERLEGRKYVVESGRHWCEIWVPQRPSEWALSKVVCPDIAEEPRFALDDTGTIVNGDCYWLPFEESVPDEEKALIVAVANSSFATRFYDTVCGNKLYSGRRRYITQYVEKFPIPRLDKANSERVLKIVTALREGCAEPGSEAELDGIVWRAFGLSPEEV